MSRPFTGKEGVGKRYVKRPNGDTYVYERKTVYDRETRKTLTLSNKLLGKILSGTEELVRTRPRKASAKEETPLLASRQHIGTSQILDWVGKASQIDEDLHQSFPLGGDADKIASIARYWVTTGGQPLTRLESWQVMHPSPYENHISEFTYSNLFKSVRQNEDEVQRYFIARSSHLSRDEILAFDSTTTSTYSSNQKEARKGFNKDGDGLETIKLLTLYSLRSQEPIAFAKQSGNLPDVITIKNTLEQVNSLNLGKPLIVTDNGYYSEENIARFCQEGLGFLSLANKEVTWIKSEIDAHRSELNKMENVCPFDTGIRGCTSNILRDVEQVLPRQSGKGPHKLYVYIFYNGERAFNEDREFSARLLELREQLKKGVTEFKHRAKADIDKFINVSNEGDGKVYRFNEENIAEASKYRGFFAILTNVQMETFEALRVYRLREKIEEMFSCYKAEMDGRRPRTWYPDNLRGRQFTQFIALGYKSFLDNKIASVKEGLIEYLNTYEKILKQADENPSLSLKKLLSENNMSVGDKKLRESLLHWLKGRSLQQILDWFDCVEETVVKTQTGQRRWSTESTKRDSLFLDLLMKNETTESENSHGSSSE